MTIGCMAWKEGGGRSGWKSACNLALHAVSLGTPWIKRDKKARNTKYLYFEESYEESIEETWRVHEAWRDAILKVEDGGNTALRKEGEGGGDGKKKGEPAAAGGSEKLEKRAPQTQKKLPPFHTKSVFFGRRFLMIFLKFAWTAFCRFGSQSVPN